MRCIRGFGIAGRTCLGFDTALHLVKPLGFDLSESRVSQMHSSILARLKAQMQHRARELEPAE